MSIDAQTIKVGFKKYPILVICGALVIALIVVLYSRADLLAAQQAELDKYTTEGKRYRANVQNAVQLQEQLNFLIQANDAVKNRSLTAEGLARNLQYFYRLENEVGIKYLDLRPGGRSGKAAIYLPLNYIVSIEGNFAQVIAFLRHLEQGEYFCRINSASASKNGTTITLNLNLDLLGTP